MFESALKMRDLSYGTKITYKMLVSAGLIVFAVVLPQLIHLALGVQGGMQWLPMYLPVLIGGCLLGAKWGILVGVLSPLMSFLITSTMGNPMPMATRLPFMMAELAVFAVVSGLFTNKIVQNGLWSFPAVILAQVTGRVSFLGLVALTQNMTNFTVSMIWQQIHAGFIGLFSQAIIVPVLIIRLRKFMVKSND